MMVYMIRRLPRSVVDELLGYTNDDTIVSHCDETCWGAAFVGLVGQQGNVKRPEFLCIWKMTDNNWRILRYTGWIQLEQFSCYSAQSELVNITTSTNRRNSVLSRIKEEPRRTALMHAGMISEVGERAGHKPLTTCVLRPLLLKHIYAVS